MICKRNVGQRNRMEDKIKEKEVNESMRRSCGQKEHLPAFIIPLAHISSHQCEVLVTSLRSRLTIRCFELLKHRKFHTNTGSGEFLADGRLRLSVSEASAGLTPHC